MVNRAYELFRYRNSDGSSKDWAIRTNGDGTFTKRWGKTDSRLTSKDFPMSHPDDIHGEKLRKLNKGYQSLGQFFIDVEGNISAVPPDSSTATVSNPPQEDPRIYWRIKILPAMSHSPAIPFLQGMINGYADKILEHYPDCLWVKNIRNGRSFLQAGAGSLRHADGIGALLLIMALKKIAPEGILVSLSHDDGVEISAQLKLESQALAFFDSDLQSVRSIAEHIALLDKKLDLAMIESETDDFYF